jgi:CRP-like cAMP-binding protein
MLLRNIPARRDIVAEGDRPSHCCLILEGFVCRYKLLNEGRRQIMSFHTPGDIPDLQSLHLKTMDHNIGTLADSKLGFVSHTELGKLIHRFPGLVSQFWRDTLIDAAIFREWVVGLGRRTAHQRIAHLMCEMLLRIKAVSLARDHEYPLPLTQAELADALGLTVVHVNRVLRSLREDGILRVDRNSVSILDWERTKELAEFDPLYLHQDKELPT